MNDLLNTYSEVLVIEDDAVGQTVVRWECSRCDHDVSDEPCPDHAPLADLPGLRLIECDANPKHYTWVHQRDDYGVPCPWCLLADHAKREAEARQCRHWGWRRTRAFRKLVGVAYILGVITGSGSTWGDGHDWCVTITHFRGERPYILGFSRETWRCWLKGRHRRGEPVGFGFCGKCVPWPCCGSKREAHNPGCVEDVPA
jgi:hypothetical protein